MPIKQPTDITSFFASGKTVSVCKPQVSWQEFDEKTCDMSSEDVILEALQLGEMSSVQLTSACHSRPKGLDYALAKLQARGLIKRRKEAGGMTSRVYWSLA